MSLTSAEFGDFVGAQKRTLPRPFEKEIRIVYRDTSLRSSYGSFLSNFIGLGA